LLAFVIFVSFVADPSLRAPGGGVSAQSVINDSDLQRASGARMVAVRGLAGGAIARLPLEVYVARVLAGEGEPGAPDATQESLAIAIRTFAVFNIGRHDGFDLCDTTHCQVLRTATANSRRAVLATAGRILTYQGAPAEIFYSASCGGRSESASEIWARSNLPYLRSVEDDVHEEDTPWILDLTLEDAERALRRNGFEGSLQDVEVAARNDSGRASRLQLRGMRPEAITGEQFRSALGATVVRSTAFSVAKRGSALRLTGRGYGHGVGMCVIGAGRRARRGESVEAILEKYYPGLTISRLGDVPAPVIADAPLVAPAASPRGLIRVPNGSTFSAAELQRLAARAQQALATTLGQTVEPVAIELHDTLDGFRAATGRPWWVSAAVTGTRVDLAPAALLGQREGVETVLRVAIAEVLMTRALAGRPAWVRVGGARYFARATAGSAASGAKSRGPLRCPADAELTLAISAGAQRDAEARAEACFARAYARANDWRSVR
jgi:stage II sporulation protein D